MRCEESTSVRTPEDRLFRLVEASFGVSGPAACAEKLGVSRTALAQLAAFLDGRGEPPVEAPDLLATLDRAFTVIDRHTAWLALHEGLRYPLSFAGVRWQRRLGPLGAHHVAFARAIAKLRLERLGLHVGERVLIGGQAADWAVAGLLPNGRRLRLAIQLRRPTSLVGALAEDLVDDAIAAEGFAILAFRDWQLRFPGACAAHVARAIAGEAPFYRPPIKLLDPDDDHPIHVLQAAPRWLTPRDKTPHWALREALRCSEPALDEAQLLTSYHDRLVERTRETAEGDEWTYTG